MLYEQSNSLIAVGMADGICHQTRYVTEKQEEIRYLGNMLVHLSPEGQVYASAQCDEHPGKLSFDDALVLMSKCKTNTWSPGKVGGKRPIIIGGCARTGTTLLLSILGAHPDVFAIGDESYAFSPLPIKPNKLIAVPDDKRLCEKTPKNVHSFEEIYKYFNGDVDLIHIMRDGREVCTSKHPRFSGYYVSPERWVEDTRMGLACWHACPIFYENLVTKTEETIRRLCENIKLEFHPNMLDHSKHTNVQNNAAWEKEATKIETHSLSKSKNLEHAKRLKEFMDHKPAVKLLKALGYE